MSGSTRRPIDDLPAPPASDDARAAPQASPEATRRVRITIDHVTAATLATHRDAWADLCRRTLDPNIFLDPAFALPLLQHGGMRRNLSFLLVWEDCEPAFFGQLLGLFPIELPRAGLGSVARGFAHEQASCGTPLVDRLHADEVFEAVFAWLGGRSVALSLTGIAGEGAFFSALRRFCGEPMRRLAVIEERKRAVLNGPDDTGGRVASFASAKRRKERARQLRRLSEAGVRIYTSARAPADVAVAVELFLALELGGWKGTRGTALLANPALATFTRTMTRLMAADGRCRVDSIEVDGRPVAMGIILSDGDRAYFWKTTFDEAYASYSPGVQLTLELTRTQLADGEIAITDSCAIADHPMIDRLWPDRMPVLDLMVSVPPGHAPRFDRIMRLEMLRRRVRHRAKSLWHAARRIRGR